jgi:hypothetical protein
MGATQDYQMRIEHPPSERDPKIPNRILDAIDYKQSYASPDTAVGNARRSAAAYEVRGPQGHITITHKPTDSIIFEWWGPDTGKGRELRAADEDYEGTTLVEWWKRT